MTLGDLIKNYRIDHDMSMADFAAASGLSKAYVALLEKNINPKTGKEIAPSIEVIKKVADAIHRDFDDVFNSIDSTTKLVIRPSSIATEGLIKSMCKTAEDAVLTAQIAKDEDLKRMIKMFIALPEDKKKTIGQIVEDYYNTFA